MDGSAVGRGCVTLLLSVVNGRRALPLAWSVVKGVNLIRSLPDIAKETFNGIGTWWTEDLLVLRREPEFFEYDISPVLPIIPIAGGVGIVVTPDQTVLWALLDADLRLLRTTFP